MQLAEVAIKWLKFEEIKKSCQPVTDHRLPGGLHYMLIPSLLCVKDFNLACS